MIIYYRTFKMYDKIFYFFKALILMNIYYYITHIYYIYLYKYFFLKNLILNLFIYYSFICLFLFI